MTKISLHLPDDLEELNEPTLYNYIGRCQRARYELSAEEQRLQQELDQREAEK